MKYLNISKDFKAEFLPLLGIHPREMETHVHINMSTQSVYSCPVHNLPKRGRIQMSFSG